MSGDRAGRYLTAELVAVVRVHAARQTSPEWGFVERMTSESIAVWLARDPKWGLGEIQGPKAAIARFEWLIAGDHLRRARARAQRHARLLHKELSP